MSKTLIEKLAKIQTKLKAPKSQYNKFGNYAFRNCEDILEAVKPLLGEAGLVATITDEVVGVGNRIYVRSTVRVTDGETFVENSALAREAEDQKGMNDAQITGSSSSYARKYALNGMFLIDDTKDADATNDHGKAAPAPVKETSKAAGASGQTTGGPLLGQQVEAAKEAPKTGRFAPKNKPAEPKAEEASSGGWD